MKKSRSLAEMAAESAKNESGQIECPKCGCRDFLRYGSGPTKSMRYKKCRHCGHRVLTSTKERIIRDVKPQNDGESDLESVLPFPA